jgi:hypothetical protein
VTTIRNRYAWSYPSDRDFTMSNGDTIERMILRTGQQESALSADGPTEMGEGTGT